MIPLLTHLSFRRTMPLTCKMFPIFVWDVKRWKTLIYFSPSLLIPPTLHSTFLLPFSMGKYIENNIFIPLCTVHPPPTPRWLFYFYGGGMVADARINIRYSWGHGDCRVPQQHFSRFQIARMQILGALVRLQGASADLQGSWIRLQGVSAGLQGYWIGLQGAWARLQGAWVRCKVLYQNFRVPK